MKISKNSYDSILFMIVKIFTIVSGILCVSILSRTLTLEMYGTYSQLNIVVTIVTSITVFGLIDAVNYYYNKTENKKEQKENLDTIIGLQLLIGIISGILLLILDKFIVKYFENKLLSCYFIFIIFRPMTTNIMSSLQVLQISIGKAKFIAIRNALFAILRLIVIFITAYITHDIRTILIIYLISEIFFIIYFKKEFEKECFKISITKINWKKAKEILFYSMPMGIYVMTNSLSRDIDKLIIGKFFGTEQLAIYSNCATLLPFDIVSSAFLTIIIPTMTRYIGMKEIDKGRKLFMNYLKIGYMTTISFTIVSIVLSKEIILLLYGKKYLSGQVIFIIYTVVDMLKFANVSLVLSANGETKTLMKYSFITLILNLILNLVFYESIGFIGPAISTVIVTAILSLSLIKKSANIFKTSLINIIEWKDLSIFIIISGAIGLVLFYLENIMIKANINFVLILVIIGILYMGIILILYLKKLILIMKEIK